MSGRPGRRRVEVPADPFGERLRPAFEERLQLLGGRFRFQTSSRDLLQIVRQAYRRLPQHQLCAPAPEFSVRLVLASPKEATRAERGHGDPPAISTLAGGGILCGAAQTASFAALSPQQRAALIVVSRDMLRFPYHVRYELLEFAVYVLASRVQSLVPIHAACVGSGAAGILLFGDSGAGKSTLSLQSALQGFEFLAEDSVLVRPHGMLATGVANYLHVRNDSLRFLDDAAMAERIRRSPVIRRRSGVEKFEIDLRRRPFRLAAAPLRIAASAFLSPRPAGGRPLLIPLSQTTVAQRLAASQRYAATQPGWGRFVRALLRLPAFELRRAQHPAQAVKELRELLARRSANSPR